MFLVRASLRETDSKSSNPYDPPALCGCAGKHRPVNV